MTIKAHYRTVEELTPEELEAIKAIQLPDDIKEVKVISEWYDDHLPCIGFKINGVKMAFWWADRKVVGALHFVDSPSARAVIATEIKAAIRIGL